MLLYLYFITLCKKHVHCDIIFAKFQAQFLALLAILKPGFRISLWSTFMPYSFSFIYIFSKISYKKNVHLQMSIRIGNGTVVNDYPIDFIHITFICCVKNYPIFCNYCGHMAILLFMNTSPLLCMA
jgi:hypothetical protein